jgi:TonB family protein
MECPKCTAPAGTGDLFCSSCGAQLRVTEGYDAVPRGRGLGIFAVLVLNTALLGASGVLVYKTLQRYDNTAQAATVRLGKPRRPPQAKAPTNKKPVADKPAIRKKPRRSTGRSPKGPVDLRGQAPAGHSVKAPGKAKAKTGGRSPTAATAGSTNPSTPTGDSETAKPPKPDPTAKAGSADAGQRGGKATGGKATAKTGKAGKPDAGVKLAPHERRAAEFNAQTVRRVIRHYLPRLQSCYERATKRGQRIGGLIEIRFTIAADGKVTRSVVHSNTTGSAGLGKCIAATMQRWRFPKPVGGEVEFIYPFVFSSKS